MAAKLFLLFALGVAGVYSLCTNEELTTLFTCIIPYNTEFFNAVGKGDSCNRSLITSKICVSFGKIVECVNSKNVSNTDCRPSAVSQINPNMEIPCKVEDFVAVCENAPEINTGSGAWSSIRTGWASGLVITAVSAMVLLVASIP